MLTNRIQPRARWSDGVPVTARDFVFTLRARIARKDELARDERAIVGQVRSVSAVGTKTVRVVLRGRHAGWRSLFGNILPRHALAGEKLGSIWADRIVNPKDGQADRERAIPRRAPGARRTADPRTQPRDWGPRGYLDRLVLRFRGQVTDPVEWFRRDEHDIAWGLPPASGALAALRQERGLRLVTTPPSAPWDHFAIRIGPGGHPALKRTSSSDGRSRTGSTEQRSSGRC
jgi:hypothetical protein